MAKSVLEMTPEEFDEFVASEKPDFTSDNDEVGSEDYNIGEVFDLFGIEDKIGSDDY